MVSPIRFYIWPSYVLEIDGKRVTFPDRPGAALARLFAARGKFVSTADIIEAVYGNDEDGGPTTADSCVKVMVYRIQKILARLDLQVVGFRGKNSYRLIIGDEHPEPVRECHAYVAPATYRATDMEPDSCSVGQFLEKFDTGQFRDRYGDDY